MLEQDLSRRLFLKEAGTAAAVIMLTRDRLYADDAATAAPAAPVSVGVIGTGQQGQVLLSNLARVPGANVAVICDTYEPNLKKAQQIAPKAEALADYKQLLERNVDSIIVATPTCLHRQMVLDAIQAGKHVYCEAPLATTHDDAQAIAKAGSESKKVFQSGLHQRGNQMYRHALKFIRSGILNQRAGARAQYHKKQSWKRAASNTKLERELNWKLSKATSIGLVGEFGVHQIDVVSWFFNRPPLSVFGFGSIKVWDDGREMHDTVQCVFEYPNGIRLMYDVTIGNSFEGSYELFAGSDGTIMMRDDRAWIFKEADAPVLGWEVYARKDKIGDEQGIALVADATKLIAQGKDPAKFGEEARVGKNAYFDCMEEFLNCIRKNEKPGAGALEGFQATVVAIKASEAIWSGNKVMIAPETLQIG